MIKAGIIWAVKWIAVVLDYNLKNRINIYVSIIEINDWKNEGEETNLFFISKLYVYLFLQDASSPVEDMVDFVTCFHRKGRGSISGGR